MRKKSRFGTPTAVSPHPKKLPYGLLPWSFTFDFTSAPDPINSGGDGDDWLYEEFDGTGYFGFPASQSSYNQTVGGKSGVAKWTKIDDQSWNYIRFHTSKPNLYPDFPSYNNKFGRVNSWPTNPSEYSIFRMSGEFYFSGLNSGAVIVSTRFSLGSGGIIFTSDAEGLSLPEVQEGVWLKFDTGDQKVSDYDESKLSQVVISFIPDAEVAFFDNGGFIAVNNLTLSYTP